MTQNQYRKVPAGTVAEDTVKVAGTDGEELFQGDQRISKIIEVIGTPNDNDVVTYDSALGQYQPEAGGGGGAAAGRAILQVKRVFDGQVATGSNTILLDDTVPQITEGDEYMSIAITPQSANSLLRVDIHAFWSLSAQNSGVMTGIFREGVPGALTSTNNVQTGGTGASGFMVGMVPLSAWITAGTTSEITFSVRGAPSTGTLTFNGTNGVGRMGGSYGSMMTVTEYESTGDDMWELIETNSISGSPANVDLTWDESVYSDIRIVLDGIQPATDAVNFRARLGHSNAGTIFDQANDYDGSQLPWGGAAVYSALAGSDRVDLLTQASNAANETISGTIEVSGSRSSDTGGDLHAILHHISSASNQRTIETKAFLDDGNIAAIDTVRLFFASGNFANVGDIKVYGLRREAA